MDEQTARDYLARGLYEIAAKATAWKRRECYHRGVQDLPYAPEGVNAEYLQLREMAIANWLGLAMGTPIQRLRADGFRTGRKGEADEVAWREVWQANKLDSRQRIVYTDLMVHGRGLMSVWPNPLVPESPVIRVENGLRVHVQMDPEDPFTVKWAVKTFTLGAGVTAGLWVPPAASGVERMTDVAVVYDNTSVIRFEKPGSTLAGVSAYVPGPWELVSGDPNPLGRVPFVTFDNKPDADGKPSSGIEPLMPAQDAINTVRFLTLLAMQFSGYRQRVFTGYDPVLRDTTGNPVYAKNADGTDRLDANGQKVPALTSPGRIGVDRALVFPGIATKVFDLPESNLANYITVLGELLTQLFATAQIPPQYLLSRMANLSGDALTGAESTLASLVSDLQITCGESLEEVMRLANIARGETQADVASEVIWADAQARSFAQTVDAITKLVSVRFPTEAAFEMIPGATPQKVARWMQMAETEAQDPITAALLRGLEPPPALELPGATASGF